MEENSNQGFLYQRLKLTFYLIKGKKEDLFNAKYFFYSALLKKIKEIDSDLAYKIHSNYYPRSILFSNFIFLKRRTFVVYLSSSLPEIINKILICLGKNIIFENKEKSIMFELRSIKNELIKIDENTKFNFLSPVVIREKDGKSKIKNLHSSQYNKLLKDEIRRSIDAISKRVLNKPIKNVEIELEGEFRKKLYTFTNEKNEFVIFEALEAKTKKSYFRIHGQKEASLIPLFYGIGDKTKLGFGMVGVLL